MDSATGPANPAKAKPYLNQRNLTRHSWLNRNSIRRWPQNRPEAVFKEKHGVWEPMLELTIISPYRIVDSKLSTPMPTNADQCIPNESKMEQPIWKGRIGGRGWGSCMTLCLRIDIVWSKGNPMPELTFYPTS
jgi:hypothetical protein